MKFISFVVAALVAVSSINAELCTIDFVSSKLTLQTASKCWTESGGNLVQYISGPPPTPKVKAAMCASAACNYMLKEIYAAGCEVSNAKYLKCD